MSLSLTHTSVVCCALTTVDLLLQRDWREGVMKELERERMLRVDTEQRLHEMRVESDSCRARLQALQDEFRK